MSDFFELSEGELDTESNSIESAGGSGNIRPMPVGTKVQFGIENAKFVTNEKLGTFIEVTWAVFKPEIFAGRKIFQKLEVFATKKPCPANEDAEKWEKACKKKRDNALKTFAAIDVNCGGKHVGVKRAPTDDSLQTAWVAKTMAGELDVWEIDVEWIDGKKVRIPKHERPTGNWVRVIKPKSEYVAQEEALLLRMIKADADAVAASEQSGAVREASGGAGGSAGGGTGGGRSAPAADFDSFDDDIPF